MGQGPLSEDGARGPWGIGRASGRATTNCSTVETAETPGTPKAGQDYTHGMAHDEQRMEQQVCFRKTSRRFAVRGSTPSFQRLMRYGVNGGEWGVFWGAFRPFLPDQKTLHALHINYSGRSLTGL